MSRRFKILEGALDYLRTSAETDNPDAPAGTPLKLYQDWKKGARNVTYVRAAASKPGELLEVAVNPFGLALDGANIFRVPLSKRAKDNTPGAGTLVAANIVQEVPNTAKENRGFLPAKATISVPSGSTSTGLETSKLTGVKYRANNKVSYTIPYGKKTGVLVESEVRAAILGAVGNVTGAQVTFESERL